MKVELSSRFAEVSYSAHALMLSRKVKQRSDENVHIYAERLLSLAEETYAGVMRNNPLTLQAAITAVMHEHNLGRRFSLRSGHSEKYVDSQHEPMEVGHYRSTEQCFHCKKWRHKARDCTFRRKIQVTDQCQK